MALTTIPAAGAKVRGSVLDDLITEVRTTFARKTAAETVNNSVTLQDDDDLALAVDANAVYVGHLHLNVTSPAAADFALALSVPTGATTPAWHMDNGANSQHTDFDISNSASGSGIATSGSSDPLDFVGLLITGSTAGTVTLQWAQTTLTVGNTSVNAGSFFSLRRVA